MRALPPLALALWAGCTPASKEAVDSALPGTGADSGAVDTGEAPAGLPDGDRALSGTAWFFDAEGVGAVSEVHGVVGAEVYLLEDPARRQPVGEDGSFRFEDLPEGADVTVALTHPDFMPSLTATLPIGAEDVEGVTFQAVSWTIAEFLGAIVSMDPHDPASCAMVVTVTAISDSQHSVYAVGEPGVVVDVVREDGAPMDPADAAPLYFNTSVLPDRSLSETTTDGGVILANVSAGMYAWSGHKDGTTFRDLRLRCEPGWMSNGSPPWGMQVLPAG